MRWSRDVGSLVHMISALPELSPLSTAHHTHTHSTTTQQHNPIPYRLAFPRGTLAVCDGLRPTVLAAFNHNSIHTLRDYSYRPPPSPPPLVPPVQMQQLSGISNLFTFSAAVVRANGFDVDATAQVHALTLTLTLSHRAGARRHPHPNPSPRRRCTPSHPNHLLLTTNHLPLTTYYTCYRWCSHWG